MKLSMFFIGLIISFEIFANNIIVNGTRFIYTENEKEITISMNNTADRPALAQVWLDNGDSKQTPEMIKTPFQITPPVSRLEEKGGQVLRIKLTDTNGIPKDKESLWWLNILDIPPAIKSSKTSVDNSLQLAIRSRFKFIYRPEGLGNPELVMEQIKIKSDKKM